MKARPLLRPALLVVLALATAARASASTIHVRADAPPGGDGTSWASAFDDLQTALAAAVAGDQIWVKAGTYRPGPPGALSSTFLMKGGVDLYGGFAGTETQLSERDWVANPTVLSGDLAQDDGPAFTHREDNVYHVVTAWNVSGSPTPVLDGFVVRGGYARGGSPGGNQQRGGGILGPNARLRHLTVVDNQASLGGGLGMPNAFSATPIDDCEFRGNAGDAGGGLYVTAPNFVVRRCVFAGNFSSDGGGIRVAFGLPGSGKIENCVILGNSGRGIASTGCELSILQSVVAYNQAGTSPGGVSGGGQSGAAVRLRNSIAWGNTAGSGSGPYLDQVAATVQILTSAVEGGPPPLDLDPRWQDPAGPDAVIGTADDDFRLACTSPYIDRGDNALAAGIATDLAGGLRFLDDPATPDQGAGTAPIVDLGPYEFACECDGYETYCAALPNSSGLPASISASGSTSLVANSLVLHASGGPPNKNGLFFYGPLQTSLPWGDGIRCVGGSLFRLPLVTLDASGAVSFPLDVGQPPASGGPGALLEGSTWNFQLFFRDPAGGLAGWNTTDALSVAFCR